MLIGSLISFGILAVAWMVLPVKETTTEEPTGATRELMTPARRAV